MRFEDERYVRLYMHIDHVLPVAKGGTNVLENLQVAHSFCNQSKGAR